MFVNCKQKEEGRQTVILRFMDTPGQDSVCIGVSAVHSFFATKKYIYIFKKQKLLKNIYKLKFVVLYGKNEGRPKQNKWAIALNF